MILNETAFRVLDLMIRSALNQVIYAEDSAQLQVVGVVKDFNFRTLEYAIGPLRFVIVLRIFPC